MISREGGRSGTLDLASRDLGSPLTIPPTTDGTLDMFEFELESDHQCRAPGKAAAI